MLELVERFVEPMRHVENEAQARELLRRVAAEFGFRSAFLIEYEPGLAGVRKLIDTNPQRGAAWAELWRTAGLAPGIGGIRKMLEMDMVVRLSAERFDGHPYREFAAVHDLNETVAVPISQGAEVAGMVSYSGHPKLTRPEEVGLQLLSYNLFTQLRSLDRRAEAEPVLPPLTPREKQVMRLSAAGMTSAEIAIELGMAARTVNQHVDNVSEKLGTRNRAHTIAELVRHDLLS